jgi:allophanate hydrolase subunit 1
MLITNTIRQGLDEAEQLVDDVIDVMADVKVLLDNHEVKATHTEDELRRILEETEELRQRAMRALDRLDMVRIRVIYFGDLVIKHKKKISPASVDVFKHRIMGLSTRMRLTANGLADIFEFDIVGLAQRVKRQSKRLKRLAIPSRDVP